MLRLWKAEYSGKPCVVRELDATETVVTLDGNVEAYKGDYVAQDLVKAPRGYRARHIDKVIRGKDSRLALIEELTPTVPETEEEPEYLEDDD